MKQFIRTLSFIILIALFSSCTSMKLTKNWESNSFENTKKQKILVASRATDIEIKKAFEQETVSKLKAEGINAVAAYKTFPDLKDKKNRSEEEINQLLAMFKSKGINAVLSTSLKDTKVLKSSPERKNSNSISTANIGKYGVSFANHYNVTSVEYLSRNLRPIDDLEDTTSTVELSSTIYVIETVIYDLSLEKEKQLVAVYLIEVTDPNSASKVLKGVSKIISKQFKKQKSHLL